MTTIAEIAQEAIDAVALEITDAILSASVSSIARGAYDSATGAYAETTTTISGRAVALDEKAVRDSFPDHVLGPAELGYMLEGFSLVPAEGQTLTINSTARKITAVADVMGAGTLFMVLAK